ncbi:MAG: transcriptional regulator domain-containing protein [Methylocystis sp.]|uniref:transcriptional regulator domain-containing protein n=1 Tax=Methylocystis sp. TaxID=1911079 RepID=UPI003DA566D4
MSVADWRSPSAYDYLSNSNWPGFAWEYLRRNQQYRADHATPRFQAALETAFAGPERRWGLRFRGRSNAARE